MTKMIDMEGRKIGRLTVLGYAGSRFRGRAARASWFCACSCGATIITTGAKLREGQESCGCLATLTPERAREIGARGNARPGGARKRKG
jgi:hypothetical protein